MESRTFVPVLVGQADPFLSAWDFGSAFRRPPKKLGDRGEFVHHILCRNMQNFHCF